VTVEASSVPPSAAGRAQSPGLIATYKRALRHLAPERGLGLVLLGANVALAALQFLEPWLLGRVIDALVSAKDAPLTLPALAPLVGAWVAVGFVNIGAGATVSLHADRLSHRVRLFSVSHYFRHVLGLPLAFHVGTHSGRVLKLMLGGADALWILSLGFFREHAASLIALFVLLPCSLLFEWRLGLMLSALVLCFALGMWRLMRGTYARQEEANEQHAALSEHASDALGNLPVVQSFTRIEAEIGTLEVIGTRLLAAQMPVLAWWAAASVATRAVATLTLTAVLTLGAYLNQRGQASVGQIVACMGLAGTLIGRLEATLSFLSSLFSEAPKIQSYFEVLDQTPGVRDAPDARPAGRLGGDVSFEHVRYSYDARRVAVDDVSFEAKRGEVLALVGATGSGKSTTLGLLYRAYDPSQGRILIDGEDLRAYTLDSLRSNIAVVFQEPLLFARSVRENLLVGKPDASDAELWQALSRAQARALVEALPAGLDTVLSERGRSLSGGERQRLSIARALIKAPPILILDEPTAALDASTEQLLARALEEVMRDRTSFVIAHRLATVRNATRILVLDHGRLVESGSFEELLAQNQRFAALARAQLLV
jgi:ATP-binding cassette, subfamily B, beta-glucan exporter